MPISLEILITRLQSDVPARSGVPDSGQYEQAVRDAVGDFNQRAPMQKVAVLSVVSGAMPRRTAKGREARRRALGFARYIRTAEQHQQAFAERANIFTSYLPYAIAMKCVERWARAFKDIDLGPATAGWYAGSGSHFDAGSFSSNITSFSSSVSSAIASTPGGSGDSGFSGGSSGAGGGGGGGGSW